MKYNSALLSMAAFAATASAALGLAIAVWLMVLNPEETHYHSKIRLLGEMRREIAGLQEHIKALEKKADENAARGRQLRAEMAKEKERP